jgi:tetratricopeptide (TPR) repeat protein
VIYKGCRRNGRGNTTLGIGESTLVPGGTKNVEAYDVYLRARDFSNQFGLHQAQRAIALYRRAIELDSSFALAWAGLGTNYANMAIRAPESAKSAFQELDAAFGRVAALVPNSALANVCEGFRLTCHRDWLGADAAYAAATALASVGALNGLPGGGAVDGFYLANVGRFEDAVRRGISVRSADPLSLAASSSLQYMLDGAGQHEEAEREFQRSLDITGDRTTLDWWALLRSWAREDAPEMIKERMQRHISGSQALMPFYSGLLEVANDRDRALSVIRPAIAEPAYQDPSRLSILAHWAARYGDTELALAALCRAYVDLGGITVGNIWFPVQKQTRRLPGFKALVRELDLPNYWRKSGEWGDFARPVGADDFEIIR